MSGDVVPRQPRELADAPATESTARTRAPGGEDPKWKTRRFLTGALGGAPRTISILQTYDGMSVTGWSCKAVPSLVGGSQSGGFCQLVYPATFL